MKLTREEAEAIFDAGKDRVVEALLAMSVGLEQIEGLKRRIEELERQLKQNSHRPPSSDGYRKPAETDGASQWRTNWAYRHHAHDE